MRQAQHLPTAGQHRQYALQQIAVMGSVADGTQSRGRGMLLIVHFGGILDQQDLLLLSGLRSRLLQVRLDQVLIRHIRCLQEAIGRLRGRLLLHLRGQGSRRIVGDGARHLDGSLAPALVAQAHGSKGVCGPLPGRQQAARIHPFRSFSVLHHSLMNSTTFSLQSCDNKSGTGQGQSTI